MKAKRTPWSVAVFVGHDMCDTYDMREVVSRRLVHSIAYRYMYYQIVAGATLDTRVSARSINTNLKSDTYKCK